MEQHLDDNAASEFVSGTLPPSLLIKAETHLAGCRDCRDLVAALAADSAEDSNLQTYPHERLSPSQVTQRPTRTLTIGDRVGRYLVLTALGAGGMGVVFAAYDPQLDRKVALKLLRAGLTYNTKDARTRLRREAQAIAQLSHPNVVAAYDVGTTEEGDLYIAMEFVEGDTLTTWLKKWPRTWREIVDVFLQAARGLVAAHSVGLLHRDFKPDNVLVGGDGRVRVTDFGLARSLMVPDEAVRPRPDMAALSVELTATGTVLGTPRYMAPEQLTGPDIDARADQFSFCVALFEALWDAHPLPGATSVSMLEKGEKAISPPEGTKVPPAIIRAVQRGLERDRAKRFATMTALIAELVPPPMRSSRNAALAGVAILVVGAASTAMLVRRDPPAPQPAPASEQAKDELIARLKRSEEERQQLLIELTKLKLAARDVEYLIKKLEQKDAEIRLLVDRVAEIQAKAVLPKPKLRSREPSQSVQVVSAISHAEADLEGCFIEWSERELGDADLLVRLTVGSDGLGHSASAITGPDSPMLKLCVTGALSRVGYPMGPEVLDVEVNVQWSAGMLALGAKVIGRRRDAGSVELQ
ncbi:MAG: protein kinase [Kofleriaceae bacterium]